MSTPEQFEGGFLTELLKDAKANTIAIGAASMVPLLAMVGGGVDASRYYMAQSRLQAACDAGALAARRAMDDEEFTAEHRTIGENFFDQNFESGMFGLENGVRQYSVNVDGEVVGAASGDLPTSLMGVFGYDGFGLSVECTADINISNTDVMFVLDVTGSMNSSIGGERKIVSLREAVMTFYDAVEESTSPRAQVRYGMVPYNYNVNVGGELVADMVANGTNWMATDAVFQSRWAKFEREEEWNQIGTNVLEIDLDGDESSIGTNQETQSVADASECAALKPDDLPLFVYDPLGTHQGLDNERVEGNFRYRQYDDDNERVRRGEGFANFNSSSNTCTFGQNLFEDRADVTFETVEERTLQDPEFKEWVYSQIDTSSPPGGDNPADSPPGWEAIDLTDLYDDTPTVDLPIGTNGAMQNVRWDGCIEEADTAAVENFDPIPAAALDMNINLRPSNNAERWKPMLQAAAWERRNGNGVTNRSDANVNRGGFTRGDVAESERINTKGVIVGQARPRYACPAPAFRLRDITRAELQTQVNGLVPNGNTYHDIGMLWGARFISPRGIFRDDNEAAPNGDAIARHIVFMTDGVLVTSRENYGTYGVERWARRVSGNGNNNRLFRSHENRFQAACRLARRENISVWVVAFGTTLTQNLIDCATPGRAFAADDADELDARFREIAQRIAALRLTN